MNVRKRAESSTPAIPTTRLDGKPDFFHASCTIASSGLVTSTRMAFFDARADLLDDRADDLRVLEQEVVARHAGLAGQPGGDHDHVGVGRLVVAVGADDAGVVAVDRPRLREVERLALRDALHDVDQHDVAELLLHRVLRDRGADVARAHYGDLRPSGHRDVLSWLRCRVRWPERDVLHLPAAPVAGSVLGGLSADPACTAARAAHPERSAFDGTSRRDLLPGLHDRHAVSCAGQPPRRRRIGRARPPWQSRTTSYGTWTRRTPHHGRARRTGRGHTIASHVAGRRIVRCAGRRLASGPRRVKQPVRGVGLIRATAPSSRRGSHGPPRSRRTPSASQADDRAGRRQAHRAHVRAVALAVAARQRVVREQHRPARRGGAVPLVALQGERAVQGRRAREARRLGHHGARRHAHAAADALDRPRRSRAARGNRRRRGRTAAALGPRHQRGPDAAQLARGRATCPPRGRAAAGSDRGAARRRRRRRARPGASGTPSARAR